MNEDQSPNPYAAVLADLERERDQINGMIAMMKKRMGLSADDGPVGARTTASAELPSEIRTDTFFGMTISEAIKKYLAMVKRPQRATDIAKALDQGGLLHSATNWLATVQSTLNRMKGVVVRVPNGWGLLEWYPGRKFERPEPVKKKKKKAKKEPTSPRVQKATSEGNVAVHPEKAS